MPLSPRSTKSMSLRLPAFQSGNLHLSKPVNICNLFYIPTSVLPHRHMDALRNAETIPRPFRKPQPLDLNLLIDSSQVSNSPSTPSQLLPTEELVTDNHQIQFLFDGREASPLNEIPLSSKPDGLVRMICLTPVGSNLLWECAIDEPLNPITLKRVSPRGGGPSSSKRMEWGDSGVTKTWNFGILPQTLCAPFIGFHSFHDWPSFDGIVQDGRPIEVIDVAGDRGACRQLGEVYMLKPLGVYGVIDPEKGFLSWKIVGISGDHQMAPTLHNLNDVYLNLPGMLEDVQTWLRQSGCSDADKAERSLYHPPSGSHRSIILEGHCAWREAGGHQASDRTYDPLCWSRAFRTAGGALVEPHDSVDLHTSPPAFSPPTPADPEFPPHQPRFPIFTYSTRPLDGRAASFPARSMLHQHTLSFNMSFEAGSNYDQMWAEMERAEASPRVGQGLEGRGQKPKRQAPSSRTRGGWQLISPRSIVSTARLTAAKFYLADENEDKDLDCQLSPPDGVVRGETVSSRLGGKMSAALPPSVSCSPKQAVKEAIPLPSPLAHKIKSCDFDASESQERGHVQFRPLSPRLLVQPLSPLQISPSTSATSPSAVCSPRAPLAAQHRRQKSMSKVTASFREDDPVVSFGERDASSQRRIIPISQEEMVMGSKGKDPPSQLVGRGSKGQP